MDCFYHVTAVTDPYHNLALEELLLRQMEPGRVLLYLWQNGHTVVIGRNQNAWRECRLEEFVTQRGRLARRISGGGAVYHDLGNLNFSFIADNRLFDIKRQMEVICRAVRSFGIEAEQSGRNDLLAQGRKFSGNAYHYAGHASLHHGTLLISSDLSRLGHFLAPSQEKLEANGVQSVRSRVMNLCELNENLTPKAMEEALLRAFGEVYGQAPQEYPMDEINGKSLDLLIEQYESDEWRLERRWAAPHRLQHRFSFGEMEVLFKVDQGQVKQAKVYSDAMDAIWVKRLEAALLGRPYTAEGLSAAVPESQQNPKQQEEVMVYFQNTLS